MGEITDMILDGTLCDQCGGVFPDGKSPGYCRCCPDCRENGESQEMNIWFKGKHTPKEIIDTCSKKDLPEMLANYRQAYPQEEGTIWFTKNSKWRKRGGSK